VPLPDEIKEIELEQHPVRHIIPPDGIERESMGKVALLEEIEERDQSPAPHQTVTILNKSKDSRIAPTQIQY
jgi:hypothetical protein